MPDVADHIVQQSQAASTSQAEADIFDGYDPQTGAPIMARHASGGGGGISSIDRAPTDTDPNVRRVYFDGENPAPRERQSPTPEAVHNAFMSLFNDQPDVQAKLKGVLADVGQGVVEAPAAVVGGAVKGINEAVDMIDSLGDAITQKVGGPAWTPEGGIQWVAPGQWDATQGTGAQADMIGGRRVINPTPEPDSATGKFVEGVSQFLTGMAVGGRALKGAKMAEAGGAAVQAAARGAISDFAFFDGKEADLSTLIQGTPLANPVSAMLAVDQDDPELVGRLKRAAEGVGLGVLTDGLLTAVRAIRTAKKARPATQVAEDPEAAQAAVSAAQHREIVGDPDGDVFNTSGPADKLKAAADDYAATQAREAEAKVLRSDLAQARANADASRRIADTRGQGVQYHGARGEIGQLDQGYYSPDNIYGGHDTFYTTDAMDVAKGYGRKNPNAAMYRVTEHAPVKFFDMEARRPAADWKTLLGGADELSLEADALEQAAANAGGTPNLREIMDEIRANSRDHGHSKNDVQDIFDGIAYNLKRQGFGGMSHTGGLRTGAKAHTVKIYLDPKNQIDLQRVEPMLGEADASATARIADLEARLAEVEGRALPDRSRVGLNMGRVNTPEDVADVITRTEDMNQDSLARAVGYRSWAEADAASGGIDGYKLLMERKAGRIFTDSEALAARKTDLAAWGSVREAARAYQATPTPAAAAALRETWVKAYAVHKELLGARAEAARALAVWRMTIDQADAKAAFRQMDAMFNAGGKETAEEIAKRVMLLDAVADPEAAAKFLEKSWMARGRDALAEAYQGALLSSPKSQVVNMLGNSVNLAYAALERAAAGRLSKFLGADDGVEMAEAAFMGMGAKEGFRDAMRYVARTLWANARQGAATLVRDADGIQRALADKEAARGDLMAMTGRKDEVFEPAITARNLGVEGVPVAAQAVNGLGALARSFGGAMAFQDDLFKLVNHRAELYALSARQVSSEIREGITPREAAGQRLAELVNDPPPDILDGARKAAEDRTFTAPPGQGARVALSFRRWMNSGTPLPLGTMLMPFVNTPANMMGYAFRRTPLAPLFKRYRDAVAAGGAEADLANTQMAMGTMAMLLMADYASSGMVTGAEPSDPAQRELWRRSGIQPYSIKVGDKWVAYNRVEPVGTFMSLGADMAQLFSETPLESDDDRQQEIDEAFAAAAGAVGNTILNKTTLTGTSALVEYLNDPQRYGESWLGSLVAPMLSPNLVRDIERIRDPYVREASNIIDRVLGRVPGASESLPVKVDLWGEPVSQVSDMGAVYDAFIPVPIRGEKQSPIDRELLRLQADVEMPTKQMTIDGIKVGLRNRPDIYNDLVKTAAQDVRLPQYYDMTMKEYLNALVSNEIPDSDLYNEKLDTRGITQRQDDEKTDVIRKVMRDYREAAVDIIKEKYARDLAEMVDRKRRSLVTIER